MDDYDLRFYRLFKLVESIGNTTPENLITEDFYGNQYFITEYIFGFWSEISLPYLLEMDFRYFLLDLYTFLPKYANNIIDFDHNNIVNQKGWAEIKKRREAVLLKLRNFYIERGHTLEEFYTA